MLTADNSLQDHILDLLEQKQVIVAHCLQSLTESGKTPLGYLSIVLSIGVVLEVSVVLVQTVVGEMDILLLLQVAVLG